MSEICMLFRNICKSFSVAFTKFWMAKMFPVLHQAYTRMCQSVSVLKICELPHFLGHSIVCKNSHEIVRSIGTENYYSLCLFPEEEVCDKNMVRPMASRWLWWRCWWHALAGSRHSRFFPPFTPLKVENIKS